MTQCLKYDAVQNWGKNTDESVEVFVFPEKNKFPFSEKDEMGVVFVFGNIRMRMTKTRFDEMVAFVNTEIAKEKAGNADRPVLASVIRPVYARVVTKYNHPVRLVNEGTILEVLDWDMDEDSLFGYYRVGENEYISISDTRICGGLSDAD